MKQRGEPGVTDDFGGPFSSNKNSHLLSQFHDSEVWAQSGSAESYAQSLTRLKSKGTCFFKLLADYVPCGW